MATKGSRKSKTPLDRTREHPDNLETMKPSTDGNPSSEILTFCALELDLISGKIQNNAHYNSKRHKQMKPNYMYEKRLHEGKQLTF